MAMFQPSVRAQSQNLVEFKAGKMGLRANNMVHPDTRKGLVYISQADDSLMHFCWKDRTTGNVEEDLIIFPDDAEFVRVAQCTTGRVYLLKLKPTNRKYFFWMQEPKSEKDDELCAKVNDLLNHPPPPGSIRTGGRSGGLDSGNLPDHMNGEMLQNALGHMDPNDLVQLLSLMGGGSSGGGAGAIDPSALLGSFMGSRAGGRQASSNIGSTPTAPSSAVTAAAAGGTQSSSATPANTTQTATTTPAAPHRVQLADLQSILSGIAAPSATGGAANTGGEELKLEEVLCGDKTIPTVLSADVTRLIPHLPGEGQHSTEEVVTTLRSPQFRQAVEVFGSALQTGQLGPLLGQFGLPKDVVAAAGRGDIQSFAQLLEESEAGGTTPAAGEKPKTDEKDKDKKKEEEKSLEPPKKKDKTDDEGMDLD